MTSRSKKIRQARAVTLIVMPFFLAGGASLCIRAQTKEPQAKQPAAASDQASFKPIFDGKTLKGWEGDSKYWRVENGSLVGEVTPETILKQNSFIIWRGGVTRDFELKVEYRVSARGNSGINYRSVEAAGQPFALRGYQA
jgi:3-keto-disaccharide hydrolase